MFAKPKRSKKQKIHKPMKPGQTGLHHKFKKNHEHNKQSTINRQLRQRS